jgi:hypothetical protein
MQSTQLNIVATLETSIGRGLLRPTRFPSSSTSNPTSPHDLHSSVSFSYCETWVRQRILQTTPNKFHRVLR